MSLSMNTLQYLSLCRVCGDQARGINFGAVTCMSCKMFFRRHAEFRFRKQICHFENNCSITKENRRICVACRLTKCLQIGMDPLLIRRSTYRRLHEIQSSNATISSVSYRNHSILSIYEWNLLSNLFNSYDEQNSLTLINSYLTNQFRLPLKIRARESQTVNLIALLYTNVQIFINRCPFFNCLTIDFRKELIQRNLNLVGSFNSLYLGKQMKFFENESYSKYLDNIYGLDYTKKVLQASQRLESNEHLIKIMLLILIFSTNYTYDAKNQMNRIKFCGYTKIFFLQQNLFATLIWKYLIYQYGFHRAVLKFSSLIKSILDLLLRIDYGLNIDKHWTMVDEVIEKTTSLLNRSDVF